MPVAAGLLMLTLPWAGGACAVYLGLSRFYCLLLPIMHFLIALACHAFPVCLCLSCIPVYLCLSCISKWVVLHSPFTVSKGNVAILQFDFSYVLFAPSSWRRFHGTVVSV